MSIPRNAKPGDFVLVHMGGDGGKAIHIAQMLNGDGISNFEHAALYVGGGYLVEAQPSGAAVADAHKYDQTETLWSSGIIKLSEAQRDAIVRAAYGYVGVPYSWADYGALALHHFGLNVPGLRSYIQSSKQMICSQLVDQCYQDAGVHLFQDNRWPGYVTPGALWNRLEGRVH